MLSREVNGRLLIHDLAGSHGSRNKARSTTHSKGFCKKVFDASFPAWFHSTPYRSNFCLGSVSVDVIRETIVASTAPLC